MNQTNRDAASEASVVFVSSRASRSQSSVVSVHSDISVVEDRNARLCDTSTPICTGPKHSVPSVEEVCPTAPRTPESDYVTSLFEREPRTGFLKITRNLHAEHLWAPREIPTYLPSSVNGYATVISLAADGMLHTDCAGRRISLENVSEAQFSDRLHVPEGLL